MTTVCGTGGTIECRNSCRGDIKTILRKVLDEVLKPASSALSDSRQSLLDLVKLFCELSPTSIFRLIPVFCGVIFSVFISIHFPDASRISPHRFAIGISLFRRLSPEDLPTAYCKCFVLTVRTYQQNSRAFVSNCQEFPHTGATFAVIGEISEFLADDRTEIFWIARDRTTGEILLMQGVVK
jgi:hypothetical protein